MTLEELLPMLGTPVTIQLKDDWWAMQFVGKSPDGSLICHAAIERVEHPETKQMVNAMVGRMNLLGPVVLRTTAPSDASLPSLIITHPGSDGCLLETLCSPESILYVNRCIRPPERAQAPSIITP